MRAIRILLGTVGFGGLLVWPALCYLVWSLPKFQTVETPARVEVLLYVIAPLLAFAYYIWVSVATPRRLIAAVGLLLHLLLVSVILAVFRSPDGVLIEALVLGAFLSFVYESQSFTTPAARRKRATLTD